ncbi:RES family NAD+ phosphorylase [Massilia sp. H6]|uniref:RES family NAD+ phosphorylase n=1 Tax=Massilia sp. H6 TaxID=2970464 RepID=UPI002169B8D6|nr:RES family NAD+ phosphorylase [Massilia sp. H6]UVW30728.1 RES family NAD+ phosphorylase [Massilia sp. H6]
MPVSTLPSSCTSIFGGNLEATTSLTPGEVEVNPADLFRVSRHNTGEPYFGKSNANRFDDPNPDPAARYGTCYLGTSLAVAVAETVLHDLKPRNGCFEVDVASIESRYVVRFGGEPLVLANLTGAALKRIGGHAGLTGTASYATTKKWSAAVHSHPDQVDGILYMSRHKNDEKAVVLFDRGAGKLHMREVTPLHEHPEFGQVGTDLCIKAAL